MTDLLRWGGELLPTRSFRAVAKRVIDTSSALLNSTASSGFDLGRSAAGAISARPQRIAACASIAVLLGTSAYCGVGYLKFKHLAGSDRTAAERAERANADLQTALDRMRNELAQTQARVEIVNDEAKRQVAASDQGKSDRVAQLTRTLEQAQRDLHLADAQRATLVARLSKEAAEFADGRTKQSQAESGLDQTQKKLQQVTAERDKVAAERDHLRGRINELEQKLSLSQTRQPSRPVAEAAPAAAAPAAVASAPPPVLHSAPAAEQPRQVAVVMPSAPAAEAPRTAAAPMPAAPAVAAVDRGAFAQIERVLASTGVDVKHMFAQLGVERGLGGPFIAPPAGQTAATMSPEKTAALRNLIKTLPVTAPLDSYELGSPFGVRGDPINGHAAYHTGVDLRAPYMTPVYATAAGVVTYSGYRADYGKVVEIDHGNGISTRYGHLHRQTVSVGQRIAGHSQIGFLGSTGRATGPHVHYEVLVNGEPQDPDKFLSLARVVAAVQR